MVGFACTATPDLLTVAETLDAPQSRLIALLAASRRQTRLRLEYHPPIVQPLLVLDPFPFPAHTSVFAPASICRRSHDWLARGVYIVDNTSLAFDHDRLFDQSRMYDALDAAPIDADAVQLWSSMKTSKRAISPASASGTVSSPTPPRQTARGSPPTPSTRAQSGSTTAN